jgi:hypothetical protein
VTAPSRVQDSTNEGRFADCLRQSDSDFVFSGLYAVWRETDPTDSTKFRIVGAN